MDTTVVNIRVEECDVYIGRGSVWGNPFSTKSSKYDVIRVDTVEDAIRLYEDYIRARIQYEPKKYDIEFLRGKTLGCYCKPGACHGDVLVKILQENNNLCVFEDGCGSDEGDCCQSKQGKERRGIR